jgi:DNA mismatch endonuclease (patch repair protein)
MTLRRELHRRGLRFRVDYPPVDGLQCRADIVFTRARLAVFVDGCFWHGCPEHGNLPRANRRWWAEKLELNVARDRRNDVALVEAGWTVIRFWEHEPLATAADRVCEAVAQATETPTAPGAGIGALESAGAGTSASRRPRLLGRNR